MNISTSTYRRGAVLITAATRICGVAVVAALLCSCGLLTSSTKQTTDLDTAYLPKTVHIAERNDIHISPLAALNSPADEFGIAVGLDTSLCFFTSNRNGAVGAHSIFTSHATGNTWTAPQLAEVINNNQSNGMPSLTPGGETMFFTGCDYGLGDCDLYEVNIGARGKVPPDAVPWNIPQNIGLPVNSGYWESQVCLSADGGALYFSSDRPGGFGGKDIWACHRTRDGGWSEPINLGENVNTSFDEVTPWLSPDGKTLYFSSNGHPGLGGFDIYAVTDAGGIKVVGNLGAPINSSADEISFSVSSGGDQAFVASNRKGGSGGYDLYRVDPVPIPVDPLMTVRGTVRSSDGRALGATVEITDLISDQRIGSYRTNPFTGNYVAILPRGYNYALTATASGSLFHSNQLIVPSDLEKSAQSKIDFTLRPINGAIELLVFFDPDKSNLKRESIADLDRAVNFMIANPDVKVELAGHAGKATDANGKPLSTARALAVKSYLVGNRVSADRISVRGYGTTEPISNDETGDAEALNRRVEMRVIGK